MTRRPRCPHCNAEGLVRSRRRPFELVLSWFGLLPYRCRDCSERSIHFAASARREPV